MADISITAANCISSDVGSAEHGVAGATITAGQVVYRDPDDNRYKLADSNSATAAARSPRGIALNGAANGQPLAIHRDGPLTIGATLTANTAYYLSDTPGGICPLADVGSGEYMVLIGIASTTAILNVDFQETGVAS